MGKEEEEERREGGREGGKEREGVCVVKVGVMVSTVLGSGGCGVGIGDMLVKKTCVGVEAEDGKKEAATAAAWVPGDPYSLSLSTLMVLCWE